MEPQRGRAQRKGQMGGGRAAERQESDGEETIEGGGELSSISTLNEKKKLFQLWRKPLLLILRTCLCKNSVLGCVFKALKSYFQPGRECCLIVYEGAGEITT